MNQELINQLEQEIIELKSDIKALVLLDDINEAMAVRKKWIAKLRDEKEYRKQLNEICNDIITKIDEK